MWWKMIDHPGMTDQDLTYNFKVKIQHAHGQKMIDPPGYDRPGSDLEYESSDLACTWSKMTDPPVWHTSISPTILKLRFNMHMVEDDWPPICHPNLQLSVSAGFHIGHHRGFSHERPINVQSTKCH